jgi:hypothetical protein
MVKGFGIIALFLAGEAAFLFHAALPATAHAGAPRGGAAVAPTVRGAQAPPRAARAPCPCPCEATRC